MIVGGLPRWVAGSFAGPAGGVGHYPVADMPSTYPFAAIQYQTKDQSSLVAPPYDVLDAAGKARLLAQSPSNIVGIDLPHTPAKELGPQAAYDGAGAALRALLHAGTLKRREQPAMFAYRQTFVSEQGGVRTSVQRCGMACTVDVMKRPLVAQRKIALRS
jgi:hypothetical protein